MNRFERYGKKAAWPVAFAVVAFVVAGCGGGGDGGTAAVPPPPVDAAGGVCAAANPDCVALASAGTYVILATAGVTNIPTSAVTGNIGVSPNDSTSMTGFSGKTLDASGTFATSTEVTGKLYASDYADPTPANLTQAITDTGAAFTDADSKAPIASTDQGVAGNLTGLNLVPGVHVWTTDVSVDAGGAVTLTGSATDVWVLRAAGSITMNPGSTVTLAGGALSKNVFWRSSGVVALDTTAHMAGIVLSGSSVTLASGASVDGRLYGSSAVTLSANSVTRPAP